VYRVQSLFELTDSKPTIKLALINAETETVPFVVDQSTVQFQSTHPLGRRVKTPRESQPLPTPTAIGFTPMLPPLVQWWQTTLPRTLPLPRRE
jgi:hypothetical protein